MFRTYRFLPSILFLILLLSACGNPTQLSLTELPTITQAPVETKTALPPPTDTPVPQRLILVVNAMMDPASLESIRSTASSVAGTAEILFEEQDSLQPDEITPDIRVVIFLSPPDNLTELVSSAPAVQFIAVSPNDLPTGTNLTLLRWQASHQAFIAGFIGVLLSVDWRTAGLIPSETPELQQAFQNGGRYFCGTCSPGWPLGVFFPIIGSVSAADTAGWAASAAELFDNGKAEVFYLSPEASTQEVLAYLSGRKQFETQVRLVGTGTPPLGLEPQWAASVGFDISTVMEAAITSALAGQSSGTVNVPVQITHVNPELLSPGRMNLVNKTLEELEAGMVIPESLPAD